MILGKKQLNTLISQNLSFVYEYICQTYNYNDAFENWLKVYCEWLKNYTGHKDNKKKTKKEKCI